MRLRGWISPDLGYDGYYVLTGFILGVLLLIVGALMPHFSLEFELPVHGLLVPSDYPTLYVGGFHVHHWMYGIVLSVLSLFVRDQRLKGILLGIGLVMLLDDLPDLLEVI